MTFGDKWTNWMGSANKEEVTLFYILKFIQHYTDPYQSTAILDKYIGAGGNFLDTANKYQEGQTEEWLGEYITKRGIRDEV